MRRDQFLSRVAASVIAVDLPDPPRVAAELPDFEPTDLVGLFRERAQDNSSVVHGPFSRHGAPKSIVGIAAGHGCDTFMAWDELPVAGVATALASASLERIDHHVDDDRRREHMESYFSLSLGITSSVAALAESGSVVLSHGPGRPRMASLIPEVHVALVEVTSIERSLAHWAARHGGLARETANLVVVTGPSRTGDIEQNLTLGVHGPRHVHVVLLK